MKEAISLFKAGARMNACDVTPESVQMLRLVCGEEICAHCHHLCEACNEPVCDDCFHNEWTCGNCGENFCEFKCESESVEKVECPRCNEPYCDNCAENTFIT